VGSTVIFWQLVHLDGGNVPIISDGPKIGDVITHVYALSQYRHLGTLKGHPATMVLIWFDQPVCISFYVLFLSDIVLILFFLFVLFPLPYLLNIRNVVKQTDKGKKKNGVYLFL
jgi:Mn2+/Fe2+ NRAMP family transporter